MTRYLLRTTVLLVVCALGACARPGSQASVPSYSQAALDSHARAVDERKDEVMRELAVCESGGYGDAGKPIYGGRGTYAGRFQFATRTVINYVKDMDGRLLSSQQALLLAQDYQQAAELAKYVIFERGHYWNWPACSRKIGLPNKVADIKAM